MARKGRGLRKDIGNSGISHSAIHHKATGQLGSITKKTKEGGICNERGYKARNRPASRDDGSKKRTLEHRWAVSRLARLPLTIGPRRRYFNCRTTLRCAKKPEAFGWHGPFLCL